MTDSQTFFEKVDLSLLVQQNSLINRLSLDSSFPPEEQELFRGVSALQEDVVDVLRRGDFQEDEIFIFRTVDGGLLKKQRTLVALQKAGDLIRDDVALVSGVSNFLDVVADIAHDLFGIDSVFQCCTE